MASISFQNEEKDHLEKVQDEFMEAQVFDGYLHLYCMCARVGGGERERGKEKGRGGRVRNDGLDVMSLLRGHCITMTKKCPSEHKSFI